MRNRWSNLIVAFALILAFSRFTQAQSQTSSAPAKPLSAGDQQFNAREILNGTWRGDATHAGRRNGFGDNLETPEPPLTDWAKQHLLYKSISHDSLSGTRIPGSDRPGHVCPNNQNPCFSADINGVPTNDPKGEYPAKDCEPLSTPAMYDYVSFGSTEFVTTPDGSRIHMMVEYHREWRTFWLNREHPKDLDPTYEGDSAAHWEGNELVVDTIGYNAKTMVTQSVGHSKSDAFHLVERFRFLDRDHFAIDMTYYDPKAWGDKSWAGFHRYYHRVKNDDFQEFICSPREYMEYEGRVSGGHGTSNN
jgi:hypothetical protein